MFFRKLLIFLCIFNIGTITSGCAKHSEEAIVELSPEEQMLATAFDLFNAENIRGTTTVYTTTYEDGTTSSETENILYNASEAIIEKNHTADDIVEQTFYVKNDKDVYCFENDDTYPEGWVRYLDLPDNNEETSFHATLAEFEYSFNEASGYSNVTITNEGTESLNGTDAIKLVVTAAFNPSMEEDTTETSGMNANKVSRKSLIADFEWSEESVNAVEGFSELLDRYVAYLNDEETIAQNDENALEEYIFWIDKESSRILQMQTSFSAENTSAEYNADIEEEFWNECWKVDWIQSDLNDGLSLEESLELFEMEVELAEEQFEYENSLEDPDEDISESGAYASKVTYVKTFLIGDECPDMTEIPTSYTETTYEDYYNALDEGEAFEDLEDLEDLEDPEAYVE